MSDDFEIALGNLIAQYEPIEGTASILDVMGDYTMRLSEKQDLGKDIITDYDHDPGRGGSFKF